MMCKVASCKNESIPDTRWCNLHYRETLDSHDYVKIEQNQFDEQFDEMCKKASDSTIRQHPFVGVEKHYAMFDEVEAILRLEQMFAPEEMLIFAKITSFKYRLRIGAKDDPSKEIQKILNYEDYYGYLKSIIDEK